MCADAQMSNAGAANMVWKYVKNIFNRLYGFYVTRTVQNFNVENRTQRLLDKDAKRVAPRHKQTEEKFQQLIRDNPQIKEEIAAKREDLVKRLQDIRIESTKREEDEVDKTILPKQRLPPEETPFGTKEPVNIPVGKMSLRQIVDVVYNFQTKPKEFIIEDVSKHYKVEGEKIKILVDYFQTFRVFDPKEHRQPKEWQQKLTESILGKGDKDKFAYEIPKLEEEEKLKKPGEK